MEGHHTEAPKKEMMKGIKFFTNTDGEYLMYI
jgi:hypothetical protein